MNTKDLIRPRGTDAAGDGSYFSVQSSAGGDKSRIEEEVKAIVANSALFAEDPLRKEFAKAIVNASPECCR